MPSLSKPPFAVEVGGRASVFDVRLEVALAAVPVAVLVVRGDRVGLVLVVVVAVSRAVVAVRG